MVYSEHPEQRACLALRLRGIFPLNVIERIINVTLVMYMQMSLDVLLHWKRKKEMSGWAHQNFGLEVIGFWVCFATHIEWADKPAGAFACRVQ